MADVLHTSHRGTPRLVEFRFWGDRGESAPYHLKYVLTSGSPSLEYYAFVRWLDRIKSAVRPPIGFKHNDGLIAWWHNS